MLRSTLIMRAADSADVRWQVYPLHRRNTALYGGLQKAWAENDRKEYLHFAKGSVVFIRSSLSDA